MNTLYQQLAGAGVSDALRHLEARIRAQPDNADLRAAFVQFLCLNASWPRALTHLKSWGVLAPHTQPTVMLLQQAIRGELLRADVLAGRARPCIPGESRLWLELLLKALTENDPVCAGELRSEALALAEASPGELTQTADGESGGAVRFDWLMDGDARLGPVCELIVNGNYFWVPFMAVASIHFLPPASVTDLVWRHARVQLVDGTEQVCQIPVRYPLAPEAEDRFLLARTTEWQPLDAEGIHYLGEGQKVWLNSEQAFALLTLERLTFGEQGDASHE
ncbi:protein of avirulence locus ImpE [Escherichia coli]|nr:protein of avirulence locus ImpE [Escherichia coli]